MFTLRRAGGSRIVHTRWIRGRCGRLDDEKTGRGKREPERQCELLHVDLLVFFLACLTEQVGQFEWDSGSTLSETSAIRVRVEAL